MCREIQSPLNLDFYDSENIISILYVLNVKRILYYAKEIFTIDQSKIIYMSNIKRLFEKQ